MIPEGGVGAQGRDDCLGDNAEPQLDGGAVLDEHRDPMGDRYLLRAGRTRACAGVGLARVVLHDVGAVGPDRGAFRTGARGGHFEAHACGRRDRGWRVADHVSVREDARSAGGVHPGDE